MAEAHPIKPTGHLRWRTLGAWSSPVLQKVLQAEYIDLTTHHTIWQDVPTWIEPDPVRVPAARPTCRMKQMALGMAHPKSNCEECGPIIRPGWRCPHAEPQPDEAHAHFENLAAAPNATYAIAVEHLNRVVSYFSLSKPQVLIGIDDAALFLLKSHREHGTPIRQHIFDYALDLEKQSNAASS